MRQFIAGLVVVWVCGIGQAGAEALRTADVAVDSPAGQYAPLEVDEFVTNLDRY